MKWKEYFETTKKELRAEVKSLQADIKELKQDPLYKKKKAGMTVAELDEYEALLGRISYRNKNIEHNRNSPYYDFKVSQTSLYRVPSGEVYNLRLLEQFKKKLQKGFRTKLVIDDETDVLEYSYTQGLKQGKFMLHLHDYYLPTDLEVPAFIAEDWADEYLL